MRLKRLLLVGPAIFLLIFGLAFIVLGSPDPAAAAPANDNFADAQPIVTPALSGIVATGTNTGATSEPGEPLTLPSPCQSTNATVWYTWTSPSTPGSIALSMKGSGYDTRLAVFTGSAVNSLSMVACNDDIQGLRSVLSFSYAADTTYAIQVGGFQVATGDFVLSLSTGATMIVNNAADNTTSDAVLTLREAMLLARGGTDPQGLGRALSANEAALVLNAPNMGISGSDLIHFRETIFLPLPSTPTTIGINSVLPDLSASGDTVSGIGAGVNVDPTLAIDCFTISGSSNRVDGIQMLTCNNGILIGGAGNFVGGPLSIQRNIIAAGMVGINLNGGLAGGTVIQGNYLGVNSQGNGTTPSNTGILVNVASGNLIGGSSPGEGNVIGSNTSGTNPRGISLISSDSNQILGNKIGTNPSGALAIANTVGIAADIGSQANLIGTTAPGEGNVIAFNSQWAIQLDGTANIAGNSIHSNTSGGITKPAAVPQPPLITLAVTGHVEGLACAGCTVDLYEDAGNQGRNYLATGTADASGNFAFDGAPHKLANYTALARSGGDTSVFSAAVAAPLNFDGDNISDATDSCLTVAEDVDGFQDGDGCPEYDNDADGVCDPGQSAVSCTGSDTGKMVWDPAGTLPAPTLDCRNQPEDLDAFKDGDGCPEPENDNDGFPDVTDDCPGTDSRAGADGMLGSPEDLNHNGVRDGAEAVLTTDDVMPALVWEDSDGVLDTDGCHDSPGDDFDGDGLTDDSEVFSHLTNAAIADTDADTVIDGTDNCKLWPNPSQTVPAWALLANDSDCDGFTNSRETYLTTNATQHCAASATANNEPPPDSWPLDMNDNRLVNTVDVGFYVGKLGLDNTEVGWIRRLDLSQSPNGIINTVDVGFYVGRLGRVCSPVGP